MLYPKQVEQNQFLLSRNLYSQKVGVGAYMQKGRENYIAVYGKAHLSFADQVILDGLLKTTAILNNKNLKITLDGSPSKMYYFLPCFTRE